MRIRKASKFLLVMVLAVQTGFVMPCIGLAQDYQEGQITPKSTSVKKVGEGSQYYLGESNELLIRVNIWGRVLHPGQYFVPATTDLITLISLAGGPEVRSRLSDVHVVRDTGNGDAEVLTVNVRKYLKTGDKRLIPALKPEDTVVVHGSAWQLVADVVQVVSQLAIVANLYYFFFVAKR